MKKVFSLLTTFAILISMVVVPTAVSAATTYWTDEGIVATSFAGGSGTEADPYEVATASQLAKIAADANSSADGDVCSGVYYELTADIDLAGHDWVPIANAITKYFSGKIDGNGHIIKNMTITCSYAAIGFIGSGSDDTEVSDLGFTNANISYNNARYPDGTTGATRCNSAGTVVAYVRGGTYTNVYVRNSVIENKQNDTSEGVTGGFAGQGTCQGTFGDSASTRKVATFTNCYVANTTVKGSTNAIQSGFMGRFYPGATGNKRVKTVFVNCYTADLTMSGSNYYAFMCFNYSSDLNNMRSATNVYATGTNTGTQVTEIATIGAAKSDMVTAMTTADNGMVTDKGNINKGYPVCKWEADWLWNGTAATAFAGGTGTSTDPYLIADGKQLALLANNVYNAVPTTTSIPVKDTSTNGMYNAYTDTYFKLTADIDLGGVDWKPIGRYGMRFNGTFDGDGHVISNLNVDTLYHGMGLFGATGKDVMIKNVGIDGADLTYANASSSVLDYNASGDASLTVTNGSGRVQGAGALIGIIGGGTVENCYAKNVKAKNTNKGTCAENVGTGGLIGGAVSTENHDTNSSNRTNITNCYVMNAEVESGQNAGALMGRAGMGNVKSRCALIFTNCYVGGTSSVTVKSNQTAYNLVCYAGGENAIPKVNNSYSTAITATSSTNAIVETTINSTTAEVVTKDELVSGIVDFDNYYPDNYESNINDGYPVLAWQKTWEDVDAFEGFTFADISEEGIREVTANLTLPETKVVDGYTHNLTWTSSDTDIIAVGGTVTPKLGDADVTLTVTSTNTGSSKTFEITVLGELTKAFNAGLGGEDRYAITKNITLPATVTAGGTSYDVDWRTSNSSVLASDGTIGKVVRNTPVCLTAYVNSEVYTYNAAVAEQVTGKTVYVDESFDSFDIGTDISRADGWTNPVGTGVKGVDYTIEEDPTNESNKVIKVNRYYGKNGSTWYLNGEAQTGNGPSRDEAAMFVLDSDPDTDGNQPVESGKIQFKARMMFETGESQRMAIWFNNVNNGRDNSCIEIQYGSNVAYTKFGGADLYASIGTGVKHEWYDVRVVLDLDASTYLVSVTREDGITYTKTDKIVDTAAKSISSIGIHSRTADDSIGAETKTSVWYVDDLSITDVTTTDTEAVAYAKEKLSLQGTATADITLPLAGEENTTITWATSDASVITKDGVVSFAKEDKTATLTATITKGNATDTKEFIVTVSGRAAYEIKGIVVKADGTTSNELVADGEITAVEILNNYSKSAKMYVALYKDDRFVTVSTADLKSDAQSKEVRTVMLDTPIELPSDINGYEARVFVWDNMTPLAEVYYSDMPDTTLWMLGDSIMTIYPDNQYPQTGWGMVVGDYLSDRVTIENHAHGGWTTATYLDSTSYDALAKFVDDIEEGDYAVIGLGINDSNEKNNVSIEQYEANYREIAQAIIDRGATPILTTTTITTTATETAPNLSRYGAQKEVVKKVAGDMGLVCIDISTEMAARINAEITAGATMEGIRDKYYVWDPAENGWDLSGSTIEPNKRDGVHINLNGAKLVADIFADLLKVSTSKLGAYVK